VARAYKVLPKILRGFQGLINRTGLDPDEVVPALCVTLCVRLQGKHPWDPQRCPLEGYLHVLAKSWLVNQVKLQSRRTRKWGALGVEMKHVKSTISESALCDSSSDIMQMFHSRQEVTAERAWDCLSR